MAVKTPLKWVGSKARLMPLLLPHLPKGQRLVEPFAGSCAVMMNTDYDEYLVADVNPDLIGFYRAAAAETSDLIERARHLFETFNSEHGYYDSRDSFNHDGDPAWRPALFLYLNRHGFNGLCRYNKAGRFNISRRMKLRRLPKRQSAQRSCVQAIPKRWEWFVPVMWSIAIRLTSPKRPISPLTMKMVFHSLIMAAWLAGFALWPQTACRL